MTDMNTATPPPPPPPATYAAPPQMWVAPPPPKPAHWKSPGAAGVLSMLPGLGHVYLGLYQRAIIGFFVWVMLMTLADKTNGAPLFAVGIPFWWAFTLIDAVRQARAINATGTPESNLFTTEKPVRVSGNLTIGVLAILFGLFFLLDRFVRIDLSWLWDSWPLLFVAFGIWQVFLYAQSKRKAEETNAERAADPL